MSSLCCGDLYETAQSALAKNDLKCLNELYSRLLVDVRPMFTNEQLLDRIYDPDHTLCRNFGAEIYVPKHAHDGKTCTAIRSEASGNCLYSSASLVLVVSKECLDTGYTTDELVKQEAILNCNDQKWSSFLCILGLSSVLAPLLSQRGLDAINILFCHEGSVQPGETFQSNHFVPLIFHAHRLKRKLSNSCTQSNSSSSTTEKRKFVKIFPNIAPKTVDISNFFTSTNRPAAQPTFKRMPNESFSSAAALAQTLNKANSLLLHTSSQELLPGIPTSGDMQPAVLTHNFDVSLYREKVKGMDNSEICHLIKNVYKPDKKYHFPKSNGRSFRHDWLDQHEWLCYSPSQNGTLQPIEMIMDAGIKKEIEQNREILSPIIDSVIFCGRLGLPLRGHRDDSKYHPTVGCYSSGGVGNFIETLNYGVRRGDKVLENHLKNCGKNRIYISKTSQNKIIKCCGQWGLSGAQLAKLLLEALKELTLSIDDCRGQGYDGAGSVAGCTNGLAAQILKLNPKALYTHCYSHRLNLSICDSLSIRVVNDMLKHVNNATNFIKISQTRNIPFENIYVIQKQTRKD
ncbi:uncharacterized protein LOC124439439 [Xenia sp. Carnegie-2017]|uniref:uncharacterized protein LOC124439439 n=1 Tax=Xenia sp. Carnegie-2017 TaxID=2897299 RepID=UPI001F0412BE|nr:uncharacterized protein LOC124439439 [Xenia sp. Carnegie-2017]